MPLQKSKERFQVNTLGMRQLHADRNPEELVKELIQNAFDEDVTTCRVNVKVSPEGVLVTAEDDGPGFADIEDSFTLMGDTHKRADPEKRGRFNLGDKELISVSVWARIETVGWTVTFPPEGGRELTENRRKKGTRVSAMMPWGQEEADRLAQRLPLIRPPEGLDYRVNGKRVDRRPTLEVRSAVLPTILQEAAGEPLRPTRRKTDIHILQPRGEKGWIMEMGIPIQEVDLSYDVDIQQKVPMPPNRDTVSESYLQSVYAEVLNAMHTRMEAEKFSENWVRVAVESNRMEAEAVQDTLLGRYGEKVVSWSSDTDANMKATDSGYEVIHPRTMSEPERKNLRELGGLRSSHELFGTPDPESDEIDVTGDTVKEEFAAWVQELGFMAGKLVTPVFVRNEKTNMVACCTMSTSVPRMQFNLHHLDDDFFRDRGEQQLELVIHELGHSEMEGKMSHGPQWGEACARVGARLGAGLARQVRTEQSRN